MNINEFAAILNGREYLSEMTPHDRDTAKKLGYVIVYGASDDFMGR